MTTTTASAPLAPGALPVIGHTLSMVRDLLGFFESVRELGPMVRIRLGRTEAYVVNDPELAAHVQVAGNGVQFDKGGPYFDSFDPILGTGLGAVRAAEHRPLRNLLRPAFQPARLADYGEQFQACARERLGAWRPGQIIDPDQEMNQVMVTALARTLFIAPGDRQAVEVFQRNIPLVLGNLAIRMIIPGAGRLPLPGVIRYERARRAIHEAISLMARRREADPVDYADLMSLLVPPGRPAQRSDQDLFHQVMNFFLGGTETSASVMASALHLLSRHSAVYDKLEAELGRVFPGADPGYDDLRKLPYLRQVLTEALRMYPPGWIFTRIAVADTQLGGHDLPRGTGVFFSPYVLHRDPHVFPEPDRFAPERWDNAPTAAQKKAFMPFGLGARRCIGEAMGMAESCMAIAMIVRRWTFQEKPGSRPRPQARMVLHLRGVELVLTSKPQDLQMEQK
ncbi:cytochrome P450 [Crossiella sp. SN42]|uniref:cytochrome P450 n=1 Tax=Crossiella sp. SN42 TaxID=2944808 RepID=UPI00207C7A7E|nr:cytochrome P450 [Crossiella sp. SN42]MCO1581665.1 cytochrome P450 [Crossiella sp. SN42]